MRTIITTNFLLSDFEVDPKEITEMLKIEPSLTWKKGDLVHPKARITRKFNGWLFNPSLKNEEEIDIQLLSLIDKLNPAWSILVQLINNSCCAQISIKINAYDDDIPAINFAPETIKKIAEINAAIDIDLYILNK